MCWKGKISNRKIATKDIKTKKIVKVINSSYHGYFQTHFCYELGKTYTARISPQQSGYSETVCVIHFGLHSYVWDTKIERIEDGDIDVRCLKPLGERTRFLNLQCISDNTIVAMECTIPKGTVYYENDGGEIVSEKLIINKQIEI